MKSLFKLIMAILGGLLYVPSSLFIGFFILTIFTDLGSTLDIKLNIQTIAITLCFPLSMSAIFYLAPKSYNKKILGLVSLLPLISVFIWYLFFKIFYYFQIGSAGFKGPTIIAILPTIILMVIFYLSLRQKQYVHIA